MFSASFCQQKILKSEESLPDFSSSTTRSRFLSPLLSFSPTADLLAIIELLCRNSCSLYQIYSPLPSFSRLYKAFLAIKELIAIAHLLSPVLPNFLFSIVSLQHISKMEDLYGENTHEKIGGEDLSDENTRRKSVVVAATAHAAAATAIATTCLLLNIPREPRVNRDNERQSYIDSILLNEHKCRANLRMGIDAFHRLCDLIREQGILKESQNCTLEEMVMRFLHLLGHNVRHRVLEGRFWRSRETISRQFNETLDCVVKLYKLLIADHLEVVHGSGPPPEISNDPRFASYLKGCIGALDGTHIIATVPVEEQERFRGRKTKTTQNVLAACSFDLKFTYVLAGWEGTAHDQKVLDDALTRSNALVIPPGKYYLVDAGYTHQPGFLAPYRGTIYHVSEHKGRTPKNEKELFNKRHSHLRSTIERAFGVLKKRWPMLSTDFFYPFKTQVKMALACFILHNHIMGVDPNDPLIVEATEELEEIDDIEGFIDAPSTSNASQARRKAAWVQFRNDIARNMYRDYRSRRNL